ncbi:MAG: CoA-transferase [Alphaproteobacteria bacterium]|jgi:glutaconate CoA-transferase subunit B|nr:CoA-transferase [Alphaproteobacteria bacterium]
MSDYTWKEMMAVLFCREMEDGDRVTAGAHTEIFFAATMLAQKMHAPNMKLQLGGTCFLCNVTDVEIDQLPATSSSYELLKYAESVHDHSETMLFYCPPGRERYYEEDGPYHDTNHFWFADKFFVGGIQADKFGNANLIGLGEPGNFKFRGPGTVGINDVVNSVRDGYVFLTAHDKRRLVEQVDFISYPGRKICKEVELLGNGPKWIVTPKAIFDFDPDTDVARLKSVFPGVTVEDVRESTGFDIGAKGDIETVKEPTKEELDTLRGEVDRTGVLRQD